MSTRLVFYDLWCSCCTDVSQSGPCLPACPGQLISTQMMTKSVFSLNTKEQIHSIIILINIINSSPMYNKEGSFILYYLYECIYLLFTVYKDLLRKT